MLSNLLSGNLDFVGAVIYILSSLIVIFLTLPIHEFAHGYAAVKLGDNTPRYQGRLSINPFAHIDYLGALFIILFGFGWAKPVQVNSYNFKNPKRDMAITAFAGPLSNVVVAAISLLFANAVGMMQYSAQNMLPVYAYMFFSFIAQINVSLAVFNLIPIPPLDGSRLLAAFLPDRIYYKLMRYERYFFIILMALLWFGVLDGVLGVLSNGLFNGLAYITSLPFNSIG